jgi:predicted nuclease with TOPRIM domain|nr:MAG TPA: hemolysin [Caudoviricetes sp.]
MDMDAIEIEHRITEVEQRAKSNTHRIDKLEPIVEEIHTMSKTMVQLVEEVKHTNENVCALDEKVDRIDSRVDEMERAPTEDIKKYKNTAVTAIISTVAGALASGLIFLIAQNL